MNRQKIRIADFSPEKELDAVFNLLKENFKNPWSKEHIISSNPFSVKKVAYLNKSLAGFLAGEIIFSEASITMIAVKKEYQGKGVGSFMLDWFYSVAKKEGVKNIWLEVSADNKKAVEFYKKRGFLLQDIRPAYYSDGSDALVMRLPVWE
ncbi:ribosomal protein S18-alanine N-acetyltransferase [Persephonella sp.]